MAGIAKIEKSSARHCPTTAKKTDKQLFCCCEFGQNDIDAEVDLEAAPPPQPQTAPQSTDGRRYRTGRDSVDFRGPLKIKTKITATSPARGDPLPSQTTSKSET